MIKKILFSITLLLVVFGVQAQNSTDARKLSERADQVKAMKIGYMADQMDLTAEQSIVFWPLYNEYWKARFDLFECKRKAQDKINNTVATRSNIDELIRVEKEQADLMRVYADKFSKVISVDQTAKMFVAEEEFKSVLLKTLK